MTDTTTTDSKPEEMTYEQMTGTELVRVYNAMVRQGLAAGMTGIRELSIFHDKPTAVTRCRAMASSLRAWATGQQAADEQPTSGGTQPQVSPGLARLRASPNYEVLRQDTLNRQEAAKADVSGERTAPAEHSKQQEVEVAKKAKKAKKEKAPKVAKETNGAKRGRASRTPLTGKIKVLVESNPKREGTRAHALYAAFRNGMLVSTYVEKVDTEYGAGTALGEIRWCVKKAFIAIEA
jgi:hypothetical protein